MQAIYARRGVAAGGSTFPAASVAVRLADPAGEANVANQGPSNSLRYHWAVPGGHWTTVTVAGPHATYQPAACRPARRILGVS